MIYYVVLQQYCNPKIPLSLQYLLLRPIELANCEDWPWLCQR